MKKYFNFAKAMLAIIFLTVAVSANAADCSKVVGITCDAFSKMANQVKKCKSLDDLSTLDFDNVVNNMDFGDLPDSCLEYRLTSADKTKLKKSIDIFSDSIVDKMVEFTDGVISREYVKGEMDKEMSKFKTIIDQSVTYQDFVNGVEK